MTPSLLDLPWWQLLWGFGTTAVLWISLLLPRKDDEEIDSWAEHW